MEAHLFDQLAVDQARRSGPTNLRLGVPVSIAGWPTSPIRDRRDGLTVALEGCRRFTVTCRPTCFILESSTVPVERFGLCEPERLITAIIDHVMSNWRLPSGWQPPREAAISCWVHDQITDLLAPCLRARLQRHLDRADPTVVPVQRALRRVTSRLPRVAMCPGLYRNRFLVRDILRFRAAAIVTVNVESELRLTQRAHILKSSELTNLRKMAASRGADVSITISTSGFGSRAARRTEPYLSEAVRQLERWRDLLSPTGRSYRSLDRTLANLPRGVPARFVWELRHVMLPRPVTDQLELRLVTMYAASRPDIRNNGPEVRQVLLNARRPQIEEAVHRVATYTRNDLRMTRQRDIRIFLRFLLDYPGPCGRTIQGLARKAIRWHQRELANERASVLDRYGAKTRLGMPHIPRPRTTGVRLLETVEDIVREGQLMDHCVATCVPTALNGHSFLFHVEHDGESATVMVGRDGRMVEAQGPRNRQNGASRWGERRLADWARRLRSVAVSSAGTAGEGSPPTHAE